MNKIDFYDLYLDIQNDPFLYVVGFITLLAFIFGWGFICFVCPPILVATILVIAITIFTWKLIKRLAEMQENEDDDE